MIWNIFKSSVKRINSEEHILAHKSFLKMLNNRGSEVGPCGTPDNMGKGEEDFPKVRTTENLDDK
jgi:hypothetical protein